jgi:hypothetical protein
LAGQGGRASYHARPPGTDHKCGENGRSGQLAKWPCDERVCSPTVKSRSGERPPASRLIATQRYSTLLNATQRY